MQVPSHVEYERPATLADALRLLANGEGEARPLAGGHSLIPMMKLRLARPELLVDINGLTELAYIRQDGGQLAIGALTRHAALLESALVYEHYPIFRDAEKVIADPVVRNWGTVGGSLCQADPSEDLFAAFAAAKATVVITSQRGTRTVTARELHVGPYETVLGPGELLTEVRVPIRTRTGSGYEKVERRVGDWSIVAVGAVLTLSADAATVEQVGIGLTAVGADQFCSPQAEAYLTGKPATEEQFAQAAVIEVRLTGSHWGCDTSNCGACTVWLDDTPIKSCTALAVMADGRQVRTVEGLAGAELDPVQQGFMECHGLQCGFCTPGMMMTARWLLDHHPDPSEHEIRAAISGQICRCTGYENIVRSVRWGAEHAAEKAEA